VIAAQRFDSELTHNFGYRYASKSIQGSVDADLHLVFNKTLSQKVGQCVGAQGRSKEANISKTCFPCDATSRNPPTENEKRFFFDFDYKTCWICGWFG